MTTVENQVEDLYSGYGQLIQQYQVTSGTVSIGSTLDTITTANLNSSEPNQNSWTLDALGNWTSSTSGGSNTFNSQNEETSTGGSTPLTYDNAGNMTTDELGAAYAYDAWGHPVTITIDGTSPVTFQYDALGRNTIQVLVWDPDAGTSSRYYSTSGQVLQTDGSGTAPVQYVWGLAYVNDLILRDRNADNTSSTGTLGITGSGFEEREYAQHDKQFSTISITDSTGSVFQRIIYDPYGKATLLDGSWLFDNSLGYGNDWRVMFQGMILADNGNLNNLLMSQSRLYDVDLGRWIGQDPAATIDAANLFQFVDDSPSSFVDPTGHGKNRTTNPVVEAEFELEDLIGRANVFAQQDQSWNIKYQCAEQAHALGQFLANNSPSLQWWTIAGSTGGSNWLDLNHNVLLLYPKSGNPFPPMTLDTFHGPGRPFNSVCHCRTLTGFKGSYPNPPAQQGPPPPLPPGTPTWKKVWHWIFS